MSAIIPLPRDAVKPQTDCSMALSSAYSALKAGKFLPKNTGRNDETIIPPKFLNELAIRTFLAVGSLKTTPRFSIKAVSGFPYSAAYFSFSAFFSASLYFVASSRYLPLSGSLTSVIEARPKMALSPAIIPNCALHPN